VNGFMRRCRKETGAAAVEFAIVSFLLFMLIFGIIDFGFAFFSWNTAANAAREGARKAAVTNDMGVVRDRVMATSEGLDESKMTVIIECGPAGGGSYGACGGQTEDDLIRVTVKYDYSYLTPLPTMVGLGQILTVTATSESRFEG
jgi:Flp pilus assembly protein TadG